MKTEYAAAIVAHVKMEWRLKRNPSTIAEKFDGAGWSIIPILRLGKNPNLRLSKRKWSILLSIARSVTIIPVTMIGTSNALKLIPMTLSLIGLFPVVTVDSNLILSRKTLSNAQGIWEKPFPSHANSEALPSKH